MCSSCDGVSSACAASKNRNNRRIMTSACSPSSNLADAKFRCVILEMAMDVAKIMDSTNSAVSHSDEDDDDDEDDEEDDDTDADTAGGKRRWTTNWWQIWDPDR
eukprot:scaffold58223_cov34-Attheya_sp.AAC.2